MKKLTWRRIHAFLLTVSMILCMVGFDCRAEASGTGGQTDRAVKLAVPQNVREEDGFIVWDEVENAYGYTIQAGKDGDTWEYTWYENKIEWNRFIYEQCPMRDFGEYAFKVCAIDETGTATEFSSSVTVSYRMTLSMPENVRISESYSDELVWNEVEDAVRYNIRIYNNDETHSLYSNEYTTSFVYRLYWNGIPDGEYLVAVQAMDKDYHVSEWTEEVLAKTVERSRLDAPQNVRFDESGENIIWDEVEGADYYHVYTENYAGSISCDQPILENWKRYISPWSYSSDLEKQQHIQVAAVSNSINMEISDWSEPLDFEYTPTCDEAITVPQLKLEDDQITWDAVENAFLYLCRIRIDGKVHSTSHVHETEYATREFDVSGYPEGDYEIELCVIDEKGNYNSKLYPLTLDTTHDESIWIPKLYHKFENVLWDWDRLRNPASGFWVRIRRQKDDAVVKLTQVYSKFDELMDLENGDYTIDVCVLQWESYNYRYKLGNWSEPLEIEKHGDGLFDEENETTTEVEAPPEAADIPEDDRITSITINPAFNMKYKDGSDVELDLSNIKIKAKEIYDETGLKRAEDALGETLDGNKHYNLLDLTLLYNGEDFSNGYDGLVKVIIPLPKGHRDKTFSCYRLTETDGKVTKEIIPGEQTEDSYIIYLEHFSEYALVGAGPEEPHTHAYSTAWKSDATGHWKECTCKDKAEESAHTQDAGTVTKEATKIETGIKTYKCSVCGYVIKTEEIAKLLQEKTDEKPNKKPNEKPSDTAVTKAQKKKNEMVINKKVSSKVTGNSMAVAWNKLQDADGYDIYAASCDDGFKGITASVGKNKTSATIRKINGKKINGKKTYKVKVKAYRLLSNGIKQYIGTSVVMHVVGSLNKMTTNAKNIRLKKKTFTLKKGKSTQIRATVIKADRKKKLLSKTHGAKLSYVSSDKAIATVTATGKIKAKKRGKCTIYVRALNGISKKIKVIVK